MSELSRSLGEILDDIDRLNEDATIYVRNGPVDETTEAFVLSGGQPPPPDCRYLLEVYIAKEVIEVWSKWRHGRKPSRVDRCAAVTHYASHDAYLPA